MLLNAYWLGTKAADHYTFSERQRKTATTTTATLTNRNDLQTKLKPNANKTMVGLEPLLEKLLNVYPKSGRRVCISLQFGLYQKW